MHSSSFTSNPMSILWTEALPVARRKPHVSILCQCSEYIWGMKEDNTHFTVRILPGCNLWSPTDPLQSQLFCFIVSPWNDTNLLVNSVSNYTGLVEHSRCPGRWSR